MKSSRLNVKVFTMFTIINCNLVFVANTQPYVKFDVGYVNPQKLKNVDYNNKKPKNTMDFTAGIGYKFNENFRGDVDLVYINKFKFDKNIYNILANQNYYVKQNFSSRSLFLNGYYDFNRYKTLTPYLTAGVGAVYNRTNNYKDVTYNQYQVGGTNLDFGWNLGAGLSYKINKNIVLDLNYKYYNLGKIKTSNVGYTSDHGIFHLCYSPQIKARLKANTFNIGLRYEF